MNEGLPTIYKKVEALEDGIDPIEWLESLPLYPKFFWQGRGEEKIVVGAGALLSLDAPPARAPQRFWGGQAFSELSPLTDPTWETFPRKQFFLPQYELTIEGNASTLTSYSLDRTCKEKGSVPSFSPERHSWLDGIQGAKREIEKGSFAKVVLARKTTLRRKGASGFSLVRKLPSRQATRFALAFSPGATFIGATPERLYKRLGNLLYTEALAGTRKRGATPDEDSKLEQELLENPKERHEFALVKTSIDEALAGLCTKSSWGQDKVKKATSVQHLFSPLAATLKDGVTDEELLEALHPTAAMGGLPKRSALEHILGKEPFDRGWYAAPFGYVSMSETELAVCIRAALVTSDEVHLFAGTGIVADSIPELEWDELNHKTAHWKEILT